MEPGSPAARLVARALHAALALALVLVASQLFLPQRVTWNDESGYVANAFKIAREGRISAAVHMPEDILRYGTDHKPVHMPAYMVLLAAWLKAFPDPTSILVLNQVLFALAVFLLHRALIDPRTTSAPESVLALLVPLATPLGFSYANTAMMEAFVVFLGVVGFTAWIALRDRPRGLYVMYLLAALSVLTRQTLVFLFAAAFLADLPRTIDLHRRLLRGREGLLFGAWAAVLALACVAAHRRTGYYPNFFTRLAESAGAGEGLGMVARNLAHNLAQFANRGDFPHDYFYAYGLALFLATIGLALRGTERQRLQARAVAIFWGLTLLATNLFYENFFWRSHRLVIVCAVLSSGLIAARLCELPVRGARLAALAGFLALHLLLLAAVLGTFSATRVLTVGPHPLSTLGIARPGDLLFSDKDFDFLRENPRCELMPKVPDDRDELLLLVDRARPRFVLVPMGVDLGGAGYSQRAIFEPPEQSAAALRAIQRMQVPPPEREGTERARRGPKRVLWMRDE